jgi:hypothetical protein
MTIRIDDPSARVSEDLSQVLEDALAHAQEAPTLGTARDRLKRALAEQDRAASRRIGSEQTLYAELESLIEEYGADAPVIDFVAVKASGLTAELEGEGRFESDVEQPVLAELDALIERYGADTPAEDVLRFD